MKIFNDIHEEVVAPLRNSIVIDLQLFAGEDEEGPDDDDWEDASDDDATEEDTEEEDDDENYFRNSNDDEDDDVESEENQEVAEPDTTDKQSSKENEIYARLRKKAEKEASLKIEAERAELEQQRQQIEYENRINNIPQERIWEVADSEGVDEDTARKALQIEARDQIVTERENAHKRKSILDTQRNELKNELYFKELEPEINQLLKEYPDSDILGTFHYLRSSKLQELMAGKIKKTERSVNANIHDRARRGFTSSSNTGKNDDVNPNSILGAEDIEMTKAFGNDIKHIAKIVKGKTRKKKG